MAGINTWMRAQQKKMLVIVCAVIMFTWVIGGAISTLVVGHRIPSGRIFGKAVSGHDLERTLNGLRLLVRSEAVRDEETLLGLAWETHLLAHEARRMGLSVSDSEMHAARASLFGSVDGTLDGGAYQAALSRFGISVSDFEVTLRDYLLGRKLITETLHAVPIGFSEAWRMWSHMNASMLVKYAFVDAYELMPYVAEPTGREIQEQYEAGRFLFPEDAPNRAGYRRPQKVKIEYIPIDPKEYEDKVEVSEESIKAYYEENREQYRFPDDEAEEQEEPEQEAEEIADGEQGEADEPVEAAEPAGEEGDDAPDGADAQDGEEEAAPKPRYRPLEAVRDEILAELRRSKAREKAAEIRRQVVAEIHRQTDVPFGSTAEPVADFKEIAEKLELPHKTTDWFTEDGLQSVFPRAADLGEHVFRNTAAVVHQPRWDVEYAGGLLVYQVADTVLAAPAPLDEIREQVAQDVRLNKAILAAAEIGAEAVAAAGDDFDAAVAEMRSRVKDLLASAAEPPVVAPPAPAPAEGGDGEPDAEEGEAADDAQADAAAEADDAPDAPTDDDWAERLAAEIVVVGESNYFTRPFEFRGQHFGFNTGIGEPGANMGRVAKDAFQLDEGALGMSLLRDGDQVGTYVLKVEHIRRPGKEEFQQVAERETPRILAEKRQAFLETWKSDLIQRAQPTRAAARYLAALGHWPVSPE